MNILILDLETTVQRVEGRKDNSPFNPFNKCVSAHYGFLEDGDVSVTNDILFHTLLEESDYVTADSKFLAESLPCLLP